DRALGEGVVPPPAIFPALRHSAGRAPEDVERPLGLRHRRFAGSEPLPLLDEPVGALAGRTVVVYVVGELESRIVGDGREESPARLVCVEWRGVTERLVARVRRE